MPDEVISAVIEQAEEIGKLEAEAEHQAEAVEELGEKVKTLESHDTAVETRVYNLERKVEEWKSKAQPTPEPAAEESLTEEILEIPIPEVGEPAKEAAKKKTLWSWLF